MTRQTRTKTRKRTKAKKDKGKRKKLKRLNAKSKAAKKKVANADAQVAGGGGGGGGDDETHLKYLNLKDDPIVVQKRVHSAAYHYEANYLKRHSSHSEEEIKRRAQKAAKSCVDKWEAAMDEIGDVW